ncbi:MAG TPA: hypothetical protein VJO33_01220, partial [Gemmatimonadaceae bacterium]|nr:hypothetical protein [Gemmatimonadaceae bacterium]
WVTLAELRNYRLRRRGVEEVIRYVMTGGAAFPLGVLQEEGLPYPRGAGDRTPHQSLGTLGRISRSLRALTGQSKR